MGYENPAHTAIDDTITESPLVLADLKDHILTLTLNAPEKRNSLSEAMIEALSAGIDEAATDDEVKVVILTAKGHVFSAGHDLKELTAHRADADRGVEHFTDVMTACAELMQDIVHCPKPVIAVVDGVATAAGCQLVASCDLAVVSTRSRFCTPGVNIGLFCSTPMVALSRNLARKQAMEMLLLGDLIDADTALRFGLVNRVVEPDDVTPTAQALATDIAAKSHYTVAVGKQAFYRQLEMPLEEAYEYAADVMVKNLLAHDAEEGICAFIEKRRPHWRNE